MPAANAADRSPVVRQMGHPTASPAPRNMTRPAPNIPDAVTQSPALSRPGHIVETIDFLLKSLGLGRWAPCLTL